MLGQHVWFTSHFIFRSNMWSAYDNNNYHKDNDDNNKINDTKAFTPNKGFKTPKPNSASRSSKEKSWFRP